MLDSTVIISYDRTNYGRVYLGDIGKRRGLGGAVAGTYTLGQDMYLSHISDTTDLTGKHDATFVKTGDVLMSIDRGMIHTMTTGDYTAFTITY